MVCRGFQLHRNESSTPCALRELPRVVNRHRVIQLHTQNMSCKLDSQLIHQGSTILICLCVQSVCFHNQNVSAACIFYTAERLLP